MKIRRFNWQIWAGFLLSVIAFLSYAFFFVRFPITRDFPWANLLLFGIAAVFLFMGVRRAWTVQKQDDPDEGRKPSRLSKIGASVLATLSVLILGLFIFSTFIMSRWLPASHGAPQLGQKAPDFSLADTNGRTVSLSELLSTPINETASSSNPRGVLLVFYRGYW